MAVDSQTHPVKPAGRSGNRVVPLLLALSLTLLGTIPAVGAPSGLPGEQDYYSADGRFVFGVTPRSDRAEVCRGELFTLTEGGRLRLVWRHPLVNRYAPGEVLVANDGTVVTLDNWESVGNGAMVVVVYGPDGVKRFNYELEQLLSEQEIHDTVFAGSSSRWWRRDNQAGRIDQAGRRLIIASTAGVRAVSLATGAIARLEEGAGAPSPSLKSRPERKEEILDSAWKYEVVGRLECAAECNSRDNWYIHIRPGRRYPQRLRLTVPDIGVAQKARQKNVKAIIHVDQSGNTGAVHAYAESLGLQKSLSLKDLFETPLRPLGKRQ